MTSVTRTLTRSSVELRPPSRQGPAFGRIVETTQGRPWDLEGTPSPAPQRLWTGARGSQGPSGRPATRGTIPGRVHPTTTGKGLTPFPRRGFRLLSSRCRKPCERDPIKIVCREKRQQGKAMKRCTCIHKKKCTYIVHDFYDPTRHMTLALKREIDVLPPAGEIARRIPPLEAGHPHTSIPRTATHDRAYNNAAMRKHAPQPQTHITTTATIDPLIMHRRPT